MSRIPDVSPLSPWEEVNRTMADADAIERLARLYREGGRTWGVALAMAIEQYERSEADEQREYLRRSREGARTTG